MTVLRMAIGLCIGIIGAWTFDTTWKRYRHPLLRGVLVGYALLWVACLAWTVLYFTPEAP